MKLVMSELQGLSQEERIKRIEEFCKAPTEVDEDYVSAVKEIVREFEEKYNVTSVEMRRRFILGELPPNTDYETWFFYYRILLRLED